VATLPEMLAEVESAISALLTGARSYSIGDRSVTREDLGELRQYRRELKNEINSSTLAAGDSRPFKMFGVRYGEPS